MWPFRSKPEPSPGWTFLAVHDVDHSLILRTGKWAICDGGDLGRATALAEIVSPGACLSLAMSDDGISSANLRCSNALLSGAEANVELVVDSGQVLIYSVDAFEREVVTRKHARKLIARGNRDLPRKSAFAVKDSVGMRVAIVLTPPYGDGAYPIKVSASGIVIRLDQSL